MVRTAEQNGGTPDSLALIAARTLGDGNRAGEIFDLNRGRAQADGTALTNPGDLRPGWILRLPEDATRPRRAAGPGVRRRRRGTAGRRREHGTGRAGSQPFVQGSQPPTQQGSQSPTQQASNTIVLPLRAVLAGLGAFLLALLTAAIVARQQVRRLFAAMARAIRRLGDPVRRARRLRFRTSLAAAFAGDGESLRTAHGAVAELTGRKGHAVHAVSVDDAGVTAWVATADAPPAPWQDLGEARWRRPAGAFAPPAQPAYGTGSQLPSPSLVAVGVDEQGGKVFVDLSRLDGVLSVTGDPGVARDVVQALLAEVARSKPAVPVAVLQTTGGPAVALPGTMRRIERFDPRPAGARATAREAGTLRAAARLHPLEALLVASGYADGAGGGGPARPVRPRRSRLDRSGVRRRPGRPLALAGRSGRLRGDPAPAPDGDGPGMTRGGRHRWGRSRHGHRPERGRPGSCQARTAVGDRLYLSDLRR